MIAYVIDPAERRVERVELEGGISTLYTTIGCDHVTVAHLNDQGDVVYVDDEGLMKGPTSFFLIEGFPNPLAGKGVVVGTTPEGDDTEPTVELDWLVANVDFGAPLKAGNKILFVGDRNIREIQ